MVCATCNHDSKKTEAHAPGMCERCNCGESEVQRPSTFYYAGEVDYGNNVHLWAERLSHKVRPNTRTRIVPY